MLQRRINILGPRRVPSLKIIIFPDKGSLHGPKTLTTSLQHALINTFILVFIWQLETSLETFSIAFSWDHLESSLPAPTHWSHWCAVSHLYIHTPMMEEMMMTIAIAILVTALGPIKTNAYERRKKNRGFNALPLQEPAL